MKVQLPRVGLQTALLCLFLPVVAGTGLTVSAVMASRMEAMAVRGAEKEIKAKLDAVTERWTRIRGPSKAFEYFQRLDERLKTTPVLPSKGEVKTVKELGKITKDLQVKTLAALTNGDVYQVFTPRNIKFHSANKYPTKRGSYSKMESTANNKVHSTKTDSNFPGGANPNHSTGAPPLPQNGLQS